MHCIEHLVILMESIVVVTSCAPIRISWLVPCVLPFQQGRHITDQIILKITSLDRAKHCSMQFESIKNLIETDEPAEINKE